MQYCQCKVQCVTLSTHSLVSLSSGADASVELSREMAVAQELGEQQLNSVLNSRLIQNTDDLFATVKSFKLKTFATAHQKKKPTQLKTVKADRSVFVDLKTILSYPISPVAPCSASSDGEALCKTNKAALLHHLEELSAGCVVENPKFDSCALLVDAMTLIQSLPSTKLPATWGQFAELLLHRLARLGAMFGAHRVDFVGDRYLDQGIKNIERHKPRYGDLQLIR